MDAPGYEEDYVLLGFDEQKLHDKEADRSNHEKSQTESHEADENLSQEQSLSYKALLVKGLSSENDGKDLGLDNPVEGFFSAEKMSKIGFSQDAPVEMFKNMSLESTADRLRNLPSSPFRKPTYAFASSSSLLPGPSISLDADLDLTYGTSHQAYLDALSDAQRSSAKASLASSRKDSLKSTPKSPRSPPNSPNTRGDRSAHDEPLNDFYMNYEENAGLFVDEGGVKLMEGLQEVDEEEEFLSDVEDLPEINSSSGHIKNPMVTTTIELLNLLDKVSKASPTPPLSSSSSPLTSPLPADANDVPRVVTVAGAPSSDTIHDACHFRVCDASGAPRYVVCRARAAGPFQHSGYTKPRVSAPQTSCSPLPPAVPVDPSVHVDLDVPFAMDVPVDPVQPLPPVTRRSLRRWRIFNKSLFSDAYAQRLASFVSHLVSVLAGLSIGVYIAKRTGRVTPFAV